MSNVVGKGYSPRGYVLSVRLCREELELYVRMLKWYSLTPDQWEGNRSDRFRRLLSEFNEGLDQAHHLSDHFDLEEFIILPPQDKRRR
ncbi:unnamed protein product [marine sediment metagenome]|uniref:Uncharacterized protein n=1 Tax=marine sediment metagenome TaxID=412755 RepID=X1KQE6_9ZZZZ